MQVSILRKTTTHPSPVFGGGASEVHTMAVVASISYSLVLVGQQQQEEAAAAPGRHLTLLPRGPAAEQTVGSPRSHHRRHSSATTPGLISAAVGRTAPPLAGSMPPPHESRLLQRAVRPPGLPASQCPPPLPQLPQTAPRIDDGRPRSLPPRHQAPPHYATPQCHCLRCTRSVRIRKFWCPVSGPQCRLTTSCPGRWATGACTAWGRGRP